MTKLSCSVERLGRKPTQPRFISLFHSGLSSDLDLPFQTSFRPDSLLTTTLLLLPPSLLSESTPQCEFNLHAMSTQPAESILIPASATSTSTSTTVSTKAKPKAAHHLLSGALSGLTSAVCLQPLDLLKTRLQQGYDVGRKR